jgi:hypothetical protein
MWTIRSMSRAYHGRPAKCPSRWSVSDDATGAPASPVVRSVPYTTGRMDDRIQISAREALTTKRWVGIAYAAGVSAAAAAALQYVSPVAALAGMATFPVLVGVRELFDANRTLRRTWASAARTLPRDLSRPLAVHGIARTADVLVQAPYSHRDCLAYRAFFTGTHVGGEGSLKDTRFPFEHRERVANLIVEVGDARILVEADQARVLCDPRGGEGARLYPKDTASTDEVGVFLPMTRELLQHARHQETLLAPGDEVVLVARVEPLAGDGPFRAAGTITHRVARGGDTAQLLVQMPARSPDAPVARVRR